MKIIKPSVEFFGAVPTEYNASLKFIEMAGRTCYKSEDKITEDSAEGFVRKLIKAGHLAMVEHSNFVVRMRQPETIIMGLISTIVSVVGKYLNVIQNSDYIYVGGSLTAWYQRGNIIGWDDPIFRAFARRYDDLFNIVMLDPIYTPWDSCPYNEIPKQLHRYSAKFICDRGVSHELVRHRPTAMDWFSKFVDSPIDIYKMFDGSLAQESTRYVSYGGKDMEFIEPDEFEDWNKMDKVVFTGSCDDAEGSYNLLLTGRTCSPQQARAVLPNALKTEIVVTADAAEWTHISLLRTAKSAHPDMQRVMNMMPWEEFLGNQIEGNKIHRGKKHHKDFTGSVCPECEDEDSDNTTAYHEG